MRNVILASDVAKDPFDVIKMLIEAGADVNLSAGLGVTALGVASGAGPLSSVGTILENDANVNVPVSAGRFKGWTPLYPRNIQERPPHC